MNQLRTGTNRRLICLPELILRQGGQSHGHTFLAVAHRALRRPLRRSVERGEVARIAREHKPAAIVAGASAYPRKIDFARFRAIADEVGAVLMVDMAHIAGLVAAGLHESPIPYAHITTTTTHKTLRGPRGGMILSDETRGKSLTRAAR